MQIRRIGKYDIARTKQELSVATKAPAGPGSVGIPQSQGFTRCVSDGWNAHGTDTNDKTSYLAVMIADMESSIAETQREIAEERQKAEEFADSVPDCRLRAIFKLRFVQGLQWKEVANMMGPYYSDMSASKTAYSYLRKLQNQSQ